MQKKGKLTLSKKPVNNREKTGLWQNFKKEYQAIKQGDQSQ
jgi:hypothetical protein